MKYLLSVLAALAVVSSNANFARGQSSRHEKTSNEDTVWLMPEQEVRPMSLQEQEQDTQPAEGEMSKPCDHAKKSDCHDHKKHHHDGDDDDGECCDGAFWMFPCPAPLGKIVTDRPGFSDSAALVPRGRLQFEAGYTFTYDREGDRRTIDHTFPEIAFRTGLTDCLEFRMKWAGYSLTETLDLIKTHGRHKGITEHDDGGTDLNLGFKMPLLKQENDCLFNLSIIPSINVPTGSDSKSANNVVPEVKFPWNYVIDECWTVYGSVLGRVQDGSSGQFFQSAATLAAGYNVCDWATLYVEYFGTYPSLRNRDCAHLLSAGPIFKINDNLSIDMRAAVGLNEQAPDFQASVGFGIRF